MTLDRRTFLGAAATLLAMQTGGLSVANAAGDDPSEQVRLGKAVAFSRQKLLYRVRELANRPYVAPAKIPRAWTDLTYDQYREIRFKKQASLWVDSDGAWEADFFSPGLYFPSPVTISVVEGDLARPVLFDMQHFSMGKTVPDLPVDNTLNYSGFRLKSFINDPQYRSEFAVFQGASYFRAIGKGQTYGLSARGLAINTADERGEEFPDFRAFWIERGANGKKSIRIYALMDSPGVAGLYTFDIMPGTSTEMDVDAVLFPRTELDNVGIAAETSMFLFDETNRNRFDDFRPAVHDSDGLLIENGAGETLWRPLANPRTLQVSDFVDDNPQGFGLMQRPEKLSDFADLEAHYHKRPGLWVVPGENWGKGAVTLVEIPADREIYDNIVAYWRPRTPLAARQQYHFTYRLIWCDEPPLNRQLARVINTRMGNRFSGGRIVTIDFSPTDTLPSDTDKVSLHVSSNGAKVSQGVLQKNPATGGVRLAFTFYPEQRTSVELRAQMMVDGKSASEVWLYRWTA